MTRDLVMVGVGLLVGVVLGYLSRSRQVRKLRFDYLYLNQVSGEYCDDCGWAMKFPDEPCRCELSKRVEELEKRVVH